jgi:N-acetylmuramoyl-L-alanine amidase
MKKIITLAGHGIETAGKRTPDDEREWRFNDKILKYCEAFLQKNFSGFSFHRIDDPTGKVDIPLLVRAKKINALKGDVLVEFHNNALTGKWGNHSGFETFTPKGSNPNSEALENILNPLICKAIGSKNRGKKKADYYVIKNAVNIPSVLVEYFFMDSLIDIKKLRSEKYLKLAGEATAQGIADYLALPKKAPKTPEKIISVSKPEVKKGTLYRVFEDGKQIGAFENPTQAYLSAYKKGVKKITIERI